MNWIIKRIPAWVWFLWDGKSNSSSEEISLFKKIRQKRLLFFSWIGGNFLTNSYGRLPLFRQAGRQVGRTDGWSYAVLCYAMLWSIVAVRRVRPRHWTHQSTTQSATQSARSYLFKWLFSKGSSNQPLVHPLPLLYPLQPPPFSASHPPILPSSHPRTSYFEFQDPSVETTTLRRVHTFTAIPVTRYSLPITRYPFTGYPFTRYPFAHYPFLRYAFTRYPFTRYPFTCYQFTRYQFTRYPFTRYQFTRLPVTHLPVTLLLY